MGFLKGPTINLPPPQAAPAAPSVAPLTIQPDRRPQKKSPTPTFLGAEVTPQYAAASAGGGKTLLGQ